MKSRLHAHIGTFRQLELLLAVYENGSIKKASEQLYLSQPTVSMQLKKLSDAIELPLYNQVGKKLVFTEAGLKVVQTAQQVFQSIEHLDMQLSDIRGVKTGTLRLAVVTSSKYFAPHLMGAFSELYPGIEVQLKVGNRRAIIDRLAQDKDDFYVFSHLPEDIETNNSKFLENPLVAIAPNDHPLAHKEAITLDQLCKENFITREKGSGTRYAIDSFFESKNKKLNTNMMIESNEAIQHAVISGLGISIISSHSLAFNTGHQDLSVLNVKGLPIKSNWYFAWSKNKALSPVAREFGTFLRETGLPMMKELLVKNSFTQ